ncbi:MAG TPA: glycoside hydrolase family 16 protein [Polyangiales bacterium]|nr:glycoside hydrolase family 16 protein [Polyangiales bacterium]
MTFRLRFICLVAMSAVIGGFSYGCGSSDELISPERWVLTMADEFDGDEGTPPDPTLWSYDIGGDGWGNQQLEFNTDRVENVSLDGQGHLRIVAREESFMGNDYTSGRIKTQGLFEQQHGRFEARIKLPEGQGLWPAFWMLGTNIDVAPWPECGEIDIMEYQGQRPARVFGSLHGPGYSGGEAISNDFELSGGATFADDFHVFAIEWDPGRITFSVDDEVYHIVRSADVQSQGAWVFNQPFFVILNLAVGGTLGGPVGPDTVFPAEVLVDYVRIFERAQ